VLVSKPCSDLGRVLILNRRPFCLGRYSLTMPLSGETSIPLDGAITLRLTQTVLQLKVGRCRLTQ